MINRQNFHDVRAYIRHIERVKQNDASTVKRARGHLRHLLEWADATPLPKARGIDPTFPTYLLTARCDGKPKTLAPTSIIRGLSNARQFLEFARTEWPLRYKLISGSWISMLFPPRHIREDSRLPVHEFYTLEDVRKIASVSTETLRQARGQVAVCLLFLSGMRADALASIPISCVNLAAREISQLPLSGVRTKNRKAALTYLLDIPDLLEICHRWEQRLQGLPPNALWYATIAFDGIQLTPTLTAYAGRYDVIQRDVRIICKLAGVDYLSPHKLRHGHVVHALKQARNMAELKAISQNIMHSSAVITDKVYGRLMNNDVANIIASLGQGPSNDLVGKLEDLLQLLKQMPIGQ